MTIRQSISLTEPNNAWLQNLIEIEEFTSKSDAVNSLIRQARIKQQQEIAYIREKLTRAEQSGFSDKTSEERLASFKAKAKSLGLL